MSAHSLTTPTRCAAGMALQAYTVPHQRERPAIAFVAIDVRLADQVAQGDYHDLLSSASQSSPRMFANRPFSPSPSLKSNGAK